MNVKHSKGDPNWITPGAGQKIDYVGRARQALGGVIDLDPYSCATANTIVGATRFFTPEDDGHKQPWDSNAVMVNHPGGQTYESWHKTCREFFEGRAKQIIWIGFSVEQLNLLSESSRVDDGLGGYMDAPDAFRFERHWAHPTDFSVLYTRKRIDFLKEAMWCLGCQELPDAKTGLCECDDGYKTPVTPTLRTGGRPSHGNYIVGIGVQHERFVEAFGDLGHITRGPLSK